MKKMIMAAFAAIMMVACGGEQAADLNGKLANDLTCDLSALAEAPEFVTIETQDGAVAVALGEDGTFTTTVNAYDGECIIVKVTDKIRAWYHSDGSAVNIVYKDGEWDITGSALYDKWVAYADEVSALISAIYESESEEQAEERYQAVLEYMKNFMYANNDNVLALYGLKSYVGYGGDADVANDIFSKIDPRFSVLKDYKAYEATMIGAELIDLELKDGEGNVVVLSDVVKSGKWVLVDFWATWCGPCRGEIPYLVEAYAKYAPKGFEIYGVSFDRLGTEERWQNFIKDNNMTWINVWGTGDQGSWSAGEKYSVSSIPTNFLYSPEGKLVAKNLRGENIETVLAEHIK